MGYLTGVYKIRPSLHDRRLLALALARWSAAFRVVAQRAGSRQGDFLRCIIAKELKSGGRRMMVDKARLHQLCLECCKGVETHLHSSSKMSLIVAAEELLGSWVGLYLDWMADGRSRPKPAFPRLPYGEKSEHDAIYRGNLATLAESIDLSEERKAVAAVMREPRVGTVPLYFGAATAGGPNGVAHMGLLKRDDGRWFALLALWPEGDKNGAPCQVAGNRRESGNLWTMPRALPERKEGERGPRRKAKGATGKVLFKPTDRMCSAILCPLEFGECRRMRENLFLARGVPKSAELIARDGEYYLHVAFEMPGPQVIEARNILAIQRGIGTLLAAVAIDGVMGQKLGDAKIEGGELRKLISGIKAQRAKRQAKGQVLSGDRKAARVVEHHLYSAGHQIISMARQYRARIVLLKDEHSRKPNRFLAYRHFHRLEEILAQLSSEAGLPKPVERKLYASRRTCPHCGVYSTVSGASPEEPGVKEQENRGDGDRPGGANAIASQGAIIVAGAGSAETGRCASCGHNKEADLDTAHLLALDMLRFARHPEKQKRPRLGEFIAGLVL